MADICTTHPEDDIFCDVGSVVANPFQVARDDERIERLGSKFRLLFDEVTQRAKGIAIHIIDLVVEHENGLRHLCIAFDEGLQGFADHRSGEEGKAWNVDGKIDVCLAAKIEDAASNVDGLVAHSLEVDIDTNDREDEAQVDGHWLFHSEQVESELIDLAFHAIDCRLRHSHQFAEAFVARGVRLCGALDGLLYEPGHHEQALFQFVEALLKFDPYHPTSL